MLLNEFVFSSSDPLNFFSSSIFMSSAMPRRFPLSYKERDCKQNYRGYMC
ncbi:hypothetical protein HanIR_Chr01g0032101 [Helianthus annuus]|nr:hypothetical protein HanIR_Chr01g0032101 [Helianthus annuus]